MGTTLEGKKVKDTYKSLVKVTDNSEAGSTGKQLSDGAGNDLGIYVDTDGVLGVGAAATAAIDASTKTDAIIVPNGTDAQQPSGTNGMIRFNTTNTKMEFYDGAWKNFAEISDGSIDTSQLADDAVDGTKLEQFADSLTAATSGHILVSNGTDFIHTAMSGDATIASGGALTIENDSVTHDKLEDRYTATASISTLTGVVSFDCSNASVFKLSGDLTGAYTIDLTGYKKGQMITVYPLKAQSVTLDAQGTSTNTFNKLAESDYDNTTSSILQIECVDDSATDPVFFYSVATFASDSTI